MRQLALLPLLPLLAACTPDAEQREELPVLSGANPAALHCVDQGGESFMDDQMTGFCRLPTGDVVEEWTFYRATTDL